MNTKTILKVFLLALLSSAVLAGCAQKEWDEVTELSLSRCLEPQNLSARVDAAAGDIVTFAWDVNKDAGEYELSVYTDENMTALDNAFALSPSEVPYTVRLTADQKYYFTVQAYRVNGEGVKVPGSESIIAAYDGNVRTYAVKDNLFLEITGRGTESVTLSWSKDVADYLEVTELEAVPVKGGKSVSYTITESEKSAAAATVSGLAPSTEYQITLFYMSASRGSVDTFTMAEKGNAVTLSSEAELKTAVNDGGEYYLLYSDTPYSMSSAKPAKSLRIVGELGPDGAKPVIQGKVELTDALVEQGASIYFESIKFDGVGGSRIVEHTSGSPVVDKIEFVNCEITNYAAGFFYGNSDPVVKIGTFKFDSCDMYGIPGSGGDAVDIRKTTEIDQIVFVNNTMYDGIRTLFRIDASDAIKIGYIDFENNTVKNIATMDDTNNRGIFAIRVATEMTLKDNLFLFEDGGKGDDTSDADRAQLFQDNANSIDPTFRNASGNYSYAHGKSFFNRISAAAAGFKTMNVDPCYNSKGNFFQLAAQDLIEGKVGASKWWISYVEKTEDLTQNVITSAHTWNLQDASLFAGDVKNSRVRDELMLVGTEANPLNADGGINFPGASVLSRKGVPEDAYISFKVDAPGSVDILLSDPGKTGASVVVALYDDNGLSIQGGAVASSANPEVQKIVVPNVSGEATVYLYSTGAVSINKLAWSKDVLGGNRVLATPKLSVEPVTISEGDAVEVKLHWDAIDNAASYIVIFNKRANEAQTETEFTVAAEDVAALKAGLYTFSVQAFPAENDIYYVASEQGSASIAVQPLGNAEEQVEVTLSWDFSTADWQAEFAKFGAVNTDTENWNLTYDGLTLVSTAKSKYNTTYFQWGGKGSTADRYLKFEAPAAGTLTVTASNTGSSQDLTRMVTVNQGGVETSLPGGTASNADASVVSFDVQAGEVLIYCTGNALRFYKVEFTYMTGGAHAAVEYGWDFSTADWQAEFAKFGAVNTDIENWNLTYDGLTLVSTQKSKYNTTFFQWGGKGSADDRYLKFEAPYAGTVTVTASNTGSSEDLTRMVTVNQGGVETSLPGGTASNASASVVSFDVEAGEVLIYSTGNALRFYSVKYQSN